MMDDLIIKKMVEKPREAQMVRVLHDGSNSSSVIQWVIDNGGYAEIGRSLFGTFILLSKVTVIFPGDYIALLSDGTFERILPDDVQNFWEEK